MWSSHSLKAGFHIRESNPSWDVNIWSLLRDFNCIDKGVSSWRSPLSTLLSLFSISVLSDIKVTSICSSHCSRGNMTAIKMSSDPCHENYRNNLHGVGSGICSLVFYWLWINIGLELKIFTNEINHIYCLLYDIGLFSCIVISWIRHFWLWRNTGRANIDLFCYETILSCGENVSRTAKWKYIHFR